MGIVATPYLVQLLLEPDADRRRVAALLLGRMRDPAALLPLADRAFDPDPAVREAALAGLSRARRHPDFRPVLERLRRALLGDDPERAASAASALARLCDADAIPLLLEALDGPDRVGEAAGEALEVLTCRRFGRDARRWLGWWKEHGSQRRVDWLFAALADEDREVRVAAAERLREAGSPPLRFLADASPEERAEAGRAWRAWLDARGLAV
jgi:HEAT repeat protein